jgi:hypothetical protein
LEVQLLLPLRHKLLELHSILEVQLLLPLLHKLLELHSILEVQVLLPLRHKPQELHSVLGLQLLLPLRHKPQGLHSVLEVQQLPLQQVQGLVSRVLRQGLSRQPQRQQQHLSRSSTKITPKKLKRFRSSSSPGLAPKSKPARLLAPKQRSVDLLPLLEQQQRSPCEWDTVTTFLE